MISIVITIFALAAIASFGILSYSAWEVRAGVRTHGETPALKLSFNRVEKSVLYIAKHLLQSIVITIVKYWFLAAAKTKKWIARRWPKVHKAMQSKEPSAKKPTFVSRSVAESKVKIKRMRERIKKEHEIK